MSNQDKNRKSLRLGILAAVVVLTMVLCLAMAGCNNEQADTGVTTANMTGGHIYGRIVGSGTLNLSGSAKIFHVNASGENLYRDNNLSAGGTINIGQLNADAVIGVMTTNAAYANGTNAFANINSGVSVNPAQFYPRTVMEVEGAWVVSDAYEMVAKDGKLYFSPITTP